MSVLLPFFLVAGAADVLLYRAGVFSGILPTALGFVLCFAGAVLVYVLAIGAVSLFVDRRKPVERPGAFYQFITRFTLKLLLALAGVRIHLSGEDKIPQGRWLLVSNHRSAFDPLAVICALDRHDLAFISKPSNFRIPIFGAYAHRICCLALERDDDRAAMKTILQAEKSLLKRRFSSSLTDMMKSK